ncbi:uncharacterized protein with LGFP repeats [Rhodococcus sp. PvR044]|uniref:LGFP repeat-containing protein n=1 Tax=Rhodococcus sp. PvR044 TaxID=3156402 RepID=UPI0033933E8E
MTVPADKIPELPAGASARLQTQALPEGFTAEDAELSERMSLVVTSGCQFYFPSPHAVCGLIRDKYNAMGGPGSWLNYPTSPEYQNPGGTGARSEFVNGSIYWSPSTGAHPVTLLYMSKWSGHGWESGWMGYPTADEVRNPDNVGSRQEFQGAAIYWHPLTGTATIGGAIRARWNATNAEAGPLGYPSSDEQWTPSNGRFNNFSWNSSIYWHSITGAWEVQGVIRDLWADNGYEAGLYGYPVAAPVVTPTQVSQQFQGGGLDYGTIDPIAKPLFDCTLNLGWPHKSTHVPDTVNSVAKTTCTDPKKKIETWVKMTFNPECNAPIGCGSAQTIEENYDSKGDGVTANVHTLEFPTNMPCVNGDYVVTAKFVITNADGGQMSQRHTTKKVPINNC